MKTSRKLWLLTALLALVLAGVGISYAWFARNSAMATLMEILPPDSISIIPIDSTTGKAMTMLDLDFKEGLDTKDNDGTIHIRRPVCIKSTIPVHQLEVVHTTNLKNLRFAIYPTKLATDKKSVEVPGENVQPIDGEYKNLKDGATSLAKEEKLNNYKDGDTVEAHAYPLYWLAVNSAASGHVQSDWREVTSYEEKNVFDPVTQKYQTYYSTYYYLEISWQENSKETDLFYIMAQNVAVAD